MKNKKAFTLVELLVVIGIIAVLSGVLLGTFGKANDAALSAVCMSNLKNLGTASQGVELYANSGEHEYTTTARGSKFTYCYFEKRGWISWYSKGLYFEANPGDWRSYSPQSASCKRIGMFSKDFEEVQYAYSHGSIFKRLSGNTSCYVCPLHRKLFPSVNWSYFMSDPGWKTEEEIEPEQLKANKAPTDRKLLFGEIPFVKGSPGDWFPSGEAVTKETDAALQVDGDNPENIGANHKVGKDWVAHVAFMDGHVEKIRIPKTMKGADLRELSKLLVAGKDITFTGSKYEEF